MVKPITPNSVIQLKAALFPDAVISVFNGLIAANILSGRATFTQAVAVARIMLAIPCTREEIFNNRWLDVEDLYRAAGWEVEYDKPAYNESYPATFTFSRA